MRNTIPPEAFDYYHGLGTGRTYVAVAKRFGVSVRGVAKRAVKEDWQGRLQRIEADARRKLDEKATEDVAAVDQRHLKMSRAIQGRALEALQTMPINSGMSAVRALEIAIKIERLVLGRGDSTTPGQTAADYARSVGAFLSAAAATVPSAPEEEPKPA